MDKFVLDTSGKKKRAGVKPSVPINLGITEEAHDIKARLVRLANKNNLSISSVTRQMLKHCLDEADSK